MTFRGPPENLQRIFRGPSEVLHIIITSQLTFFKLGIFITSNREKSQQYLQNVFSGEDFMVLLDEQQRFSDIKSEKL